MTTVCKATELCVSQGTVLSPFLFTIYTSDFKYNSESCHLQKFSAIVEGGQEEKYRSLVDQFVKWCVENYLQLNVAKCKGDHGGFQEQNCLTFSSLH